MHRSLRVPGLILVLISVVHVVHAEDRQRGNGNIAADTMPADSAIAQSRVDDAGAAARVRAGSAKASAAIGAIKSNSNQIPQPYDVIDGKQTPKLFLTYELFDELMLMGFADDAVTRDAYRTSKERYRKTEGLPADVWGRLDELSVLYRADRNRDKNSRQSIRPMNAVESTNDLCRDRFEALSAADHTFGPAFRRFLYAAVAPDLYQVVLRRPDLPRLLAVIGGCQ